MKTIDTVPSPERIAKEINHSRRERDLLRRLYRLSVDVRELRNAIPNDGTSSEGGNSRPEGNQ
ncbi:hypothetical protein Mal15_42650 [Stieleria maiorica]|uniref:Uncharacterized protein n=1 Tax=Stieleria maiorica TaxID=2795974 RepID=A0A5B9MKR7_9BACT|nr:hypothetical protein Mal15_42650 [Stieleria maiorica]